MKYSTNKQKSQKITKNYEKLVTDINRKGWKRERGGDKGGGEKNYYEKRFVFIIKF